MSFYLYSSIFSADFERAGEFSKKIEMLSKKNDDKKSLSRARLLHMSRDIFKGDFEAAREIFDSVDLEEACPSDASIALAFYSILDRAQASNDIALDRLEKSKTIIDSIENESIKLLAELCYNYLKTEILIDTANYDEARIYLERSLMISERSKNKRFHSLSSLQKAQIDIRSSKTVDINSVLYYVDFFNKNELLFGSAHQKASEVFRLSGRMGLARQMVKRGIKNKSYVPVSDAMLFFESALIAYNENDRILFQRSIDQALNLADKHDCYNLKKAVGKEAT